MTHGLRSRGAIVLIRYAWQAIAHVSRIVALLNNLLSHVVRYRVLIDVLDNVVPLIEIRWQTVVL